MSKKILIGLWLVLCSTMINAQSQSAESKLRYQQARLQALQSRIAALEKRLQRYQGAQQASHDYSRQLIQEYLNSPQIQEQLATTAGYDKGFFLRTADGNLEFKFKGFIQNYVIFNEDDTTSTNRFVIRQTRLQWHTYFYKHWHAMLDIGVNGGGGDIIRFAFIEYRGWEYLKIRVGQFKPPFSIEAQEPPHDLPAVFISPIVQATAVWGRPNPSFWDLGVMVYGEAFDYFSYNLAVMNGNGRNATDDNDDFHYFAQMRFYPFSTDHKRTYWHLAVMMGREGLRPEGADLVTPWGVEIFDAAEKNGRAITPAEDGYTVVTTPDTTSGWVYGISTGFRHYRADSPIRAGGEFIYKQLARYRVTLITPAGVTLSRRAARIHLWGFWLQGGYFFQLGDDKHTGIEPLVRISYADVDDGSADYPAAISETGLGHALDIRGQDLWAYTLGVKAYFTQHIRLEFNWIMAVPEHTDHVGPNDGTATITDKINHSGGIMHAFVFQVTARW